MLVTSEAIVHNSDKQLKKYSSGLMILEGSHNDGKDRAENLTPWCQEPEADAVHIMVDQKSAEEGTRIQPFPRLFLVTYLLNYHYTL